LHRGLDGGWTLLGATFEAFLRGGPPAVVGRCPRIAARGVLNPAANWTARFAPGSPLAVFGHGFSAAGNQVHVLQAHVVGDDVPDPNVHVTLAADAGAPRWSESRRQIDTALPSEPFHDGCALVWVSTAEGLDSNGRLVWIRAPAQPRPDPSD
ncbi:MAG: hypothetical protein ACRD2T_03995, partial [Thermoanaerobaculia bacterium]